MKMCVAILAYNQLPDTKGALASIRHTTDCDWIVIDNGSTDRDELPSFVRNFLAPPAVRYQRNEENVGIVRALQQAYELTPDYDVIAYLHNDVYVYEPGWDRRVLSYFEQMPKLGLASFFGAKGSYAGGGRLDSFSNMVEAEVHGLRLREPYKPISMVDGFAMICRREMLDKAGGICQEYEWHHGYDRDIALSSLAAGYDNIVVNVPCHHQSGITACRGDYQNQVTAIYGEGADKLLHDRNTVEVFNRRWPNLPIYIEDDFSFRGGAFRQWR